MSRRQEDDGSPDFGPRGYLPERAAKRARKIVLREPMGLHWPIAAAIAAVAVLALGVLYLVTSTGPPGPPFQEVAELDAIDPRGAAVLGVDSTTEALVVRGGGGVAVFEAPPGRAAWCPASGRIESAQGSVWTLAGRLVGGQGASLRPLRSTVHDGVLFIDPETELPGRPPDPAGESPACTAS